MDNKQNDAYHNDGYEHEHNDDLDDPISLEAAPRKFLPRITLANEKDGQNGHTSIIGDDGLPIKQDKGGIETISQSVQDQEAKAGEVNEDDDERDTWDNPLEFLLSCISMSVGLGNVWRFPGVAAKNGGGAFLIPYLCVLLFIGRPLYYLEMCLGQFSRYGQVKVWNMAPIFKGVVCGAMTGVICVCSYYCALMAITVYFFIFSFSKTLPWAQCHQDKHIEPCESDDVKNNLASYYYRYSVNRQLENIDNGLGQLHWPLVLCLAFSWLFICPSLIKGVKSSGKVAYFTAIFPYVVIIILLIRVVTLEGAWDGIKVFLEPQWGEIIKPKVWYAAVEQCFFSLATGFGPVIMFSSYNRFKQNIYKDALIISVLDTCTYLLAGITIFSVIGHLMFKSGKTFDEIDGIGGPGLAFILYPQAIALFDWVPQLFAVLFFLMMFTLGIGSATSLTGGVITINCDQFPHWKRWIVTSVVCSVGCLIGLMYVSEGGMLMLDLIDHYGAGFVIYVMAMLECAGISYCYGLRNFCNDIEFMLGRYVGIYWRLCWGFVIPVGLLANLIYYLTTEPEYQSGPYPYPKIATGCGWALTSFAVLLIPGWACHAVLTRKGNTFKEKFQLALKPTHRWGPQKPKLRKEWEAFRAQKDEERRNSKRKFWVFY